MKYRSLSEFVQTIEYPATVPAYTALQLDESENLWVRAFSPPGVLQEDWDVFAPDGVWMGTVEVPLGLTVTDVGDDHLLGIYRDELDTVFVRMYRLTRGSR